MTWIAEAAKYTTNPSIFVEFAFGSGTRKYSVDYIRPVGDPAFKGSIMSLPRIYQTIGDIKRSFELSSIVIEFSDTDGEFRTIIGPEGEGIKNIEATIKVSFINRSLATETLTLFTGLIYDWEPLDNLKFKIICEQKFKDIDVEYPKKRVEITDYANADSAAIGWIIPVLYGTISTFQVKDDGAYGHPSLCDIGRGGLPLVDNTFDAEISLVGIQTAAITVSRVYLDGVLQVEGAGNDYQISTQVIDGKTHTEIHWEAGVNPTVFNKVSCDIVFGSRLPVEAIKHFLINFCPYVEADFNAASYNAAHAIETSRAYTFDGALWEAKKTLRTILDDWRYELELDIYRNKDGEICFDYISAYISPSPNEYDDTRDILKKFRSKIRVKELLNKLEYGYNYHYSKTYFDNYGTREDSDSQTKYGETFEKFVGFRWIRSATMAHDIASRKIIRFKDPPVFDTLIFPLKSFQEDLANALKVTHFQGTGSSGYDKKLFQVRSMELDLNRYINTMVLEDASNFMGKGCILGDDTLLPAKWTDAEGAERDYCYLGDSATGQFSDGEPAKRLFD